MSTPAVCVCGQALPAGNGSAGQAIPCPSCGRELPVPSPRGRGYRTRLGLTLAAVAAGITLLIAALVPVVEKVRDAADRMH